MNSIPCIVPALQTTTGKYQTVFKETVYRSTRNSASAVGSLKSRLDHFKRIFLDNLTDEHDLDSSKSGWCQHELLS